MGAGEGFAQGVQMAGSFLMPALQQRMQNQRFDKQLGQQDKQFYDRLALDQAWKDGFYGGSSMLQGGVEAPQSQASATPYQVTRSQPGLMDRLVGRGTTTPAEALSMPDPVHPAPARTFADPVNPSPALTMRQMPAQTGAPQGPSVNRIRPNTPLPSMSMMRGLPRRGY